MIYYSDIQVIMFKYAAMLQWIEVVGIMYIQYVYIPSYLQVLMSLNNYFQPTHSEGLTDHYR